MRIKAKARQKTGFNFEEEEIVERVSED